MRAVRLGAESASSRTRGRRLCQPRRRSVVIAGQRVLRWPAS